jgi:hypothetical protein
MDTLTCRKPENTAENTGKAPGSKIVTHFVDNLGYCRTTRHELNQYLWLLCFAFLFHVSHRSPSLLSAHIPYASMVMLTASGILTVNHHTCLGPNPFHGSRPCESAVAHGFHFHPRWHLRFRAIDPSTTHIRSCKTSASDTIPPSFQRAKG